MAAGIGQWSLHSSNSLNYKKYHGRRRAAMPMTVIGHLRRGARHRAAVCELLPSIRRATWERAQRATGVEDSFQRARARARERERERETMVQDELHQEKNSPQTRNNCANSHRSHCLAHVRRNLRVNITHCCPSLCQSRVTCVESRVKCLSGETSYLVAEVHRPSDRWTWLLVCITVTTR